LWCVCVVHKKKEKNWMENDFYDSDEDTFLDRTGISEFCLEEGVGRNSWTW